MVKSRKIAPWENPINACFRADPQDRPPHPMLRLPALATLPPSGRGAQDVGQGQVVPGWALRSIVPKRGSGHRPARFRRSGGWPRCHRTSVRSSGRSAQTSSAGSECAASSQAAWVAARRLTQDLGGAATAAAPTEPPHPFRPETVCAVVSSSLHGEDRKWRAVCTSAGSLSVDAFSLPDHVESGRFFRRSSIIETDQCSDLAAFVLAVWAIFDRVNMSAEIALCEPAA